MTVIALEGGSDWPSTSVDWTTPRDLAASSGATPRYNFTRGTGGILLMRGAKGFDAPPFLLDYEEMPAIDGGYLNHVRVPSRDLFLPLYLWAADRPSFLTLKREFLASLNPAYGPGRLTLTEGDGTARYIDAHYVSGAEGDETVEASGFTWCIYGLQLRAFDPYWYSKDRVERTFRASGDTELKPFFSNPFFGLNLNRSHSLNQETTLTVTGDVDTWPEWTIVGPLTGVTFTRTVGADTQEFRLNTVLAPGERVYIDTRPGQRRVTLMGDTYSNLWGDLGANPQIWPISPGTNTVRLTVDGVGTGTEVSILYRPRFISA